MNNKTKRLLKAMARTPYSKSFKALQVKKRPAEAKKRSYDKAAERAAREALNKRTVNFFGKMISPKEYSMAQKRYEETSTLYKSYEKKGMLKKTAVLQKKTDFVKEYVDNLRHGANFTTAQILDDQLTVSTGQNRMIAGEIIRTRYDADGSSKQTTILEMIKERGGVGFTWWDSEGRGKGYGVEYATNIVWTNEEDVLNKLAHFKPQQMVAMEIVLGISEEEARADYGS